MSNSTISRICAALALLMFASASVPASAFWPTKNKRANKTAQRNAPHEQKKAEEPVQITPEETKAEIIQSSQPEEELVAPAFQPAEALILGTTPEGYDSLVSQWYERNVVNSHDTYFNQFIDLDSDTLFVDSTPDSVYIARLKNIISPVHLGFNNIVKARIAAYTRWKGTMSRILGLSQYYFPMIEERLVAHGLPIELRMMPVIESALNPTAVSRMGATGLWQFMYGTGKNYGLEITSFVDERRDPALSTDAACRFMKDLYGIYGDWTLAIAAYNCGPGNVNKALRRAGEGATSFWDVYPYLPRETRGYVPAFIAATYVYAYHRQHGIEPAPCPLPIACDTIRIDRLMHLEQVSSTIGTPIEVLRELNPQYKEDIIPAVDNKSYSLTLPQQDIVRYLRSEQQILGKDTIYMAQYLKRDEKSNAAVFQVTSLEYRVKSGDTLSGIAKKHGVTVSQIMQWNSLKSAHTLRIGQRLQIYR